MKKIIFSDKFQLTQAVLEGRKTMTRRIVRNPEEVEINGHKYLQTEKLRYKVGDVVAVAQAYKDLSYNIGTVEGAKKFNTLSKTVGWRNKMFVSADIMPHRIRITNVRVERLQYISDEDCIREGIVKALGLYGCEGVCERGDQLYFNTLRTAFAALIDKIYGKGTWQSNPWVFVYEFELVK